IVDLIANEFTDYNEIKSKRLQLLDLVKKRVQYLEQLGINLLIDPFDRIKINEQLEIIDLLGNSMYDIALIKEKIKDTCDIVENIKNKNNELFMIISQDVEFFNDKKSISNMVQEFNIEAVPVDFTLDAIHQSDDVVVDIKEIPDSLNINLVRKKTGGVITRVYELFTNVAVETVKESVVPQLVIERDSTFEKNDSQEEVIENEPLFDDNLSAAMDSFNENTLEKMESLDDASESVKSQLVVAADNNSEKRDSQKVVIENEPLFDDNLSAAMDSFNENLFEEVEPFEKVALFTSKSDDIFLGNNNQNEDNDIMPELLFDDEEKNLYDDTLENDNSNVLSFDEQIEKLMADSSKIKKLTA
ncbi:MAG: hypothetical protein J6X02_05435, partial [Bacilli bacterium]|nr:hypothetical protein [Bacilli bacterium]